MDIRITLEFFEKYKCQGIAFFSSRAWAGHASNEQSCLKTTGLYDDVLLVCFIFFYFIFSAPITFSLCFSISPSLPIFFFFDALSEAFIKWNRKSFYQFRSVSQSCLNLCDPMDCSTPGLRVHHQLPKSTQNHVH